MFVLSHLCPYVILKIWLSAGPDFIFTDGVYWQVFIERLQ